MNELPPKHETPDEPKSLTPAKPEIRVSQEEFIDDMAAPSMDKSEYAGQKGEKIAGRPTFDGEETPRHEQN